MKALHTEKTDCQAGNCGRESALDLEGYLCVSSPTTFVLPTGQRGSGEERQLPKVTQDISGRAPVSSHSLPGPPAAICFQLNYTTGWQALGGAGVTSLTAESSNRWAFLLPQGGRVFQRIMPCRTAAATLELRLPAVHSRCLFAYHNPYSGLPLPTHLPVGWEAKLCTWKPWRDWESGNVDLGCQNITERREGCGLATWD